jgi:endo-1,4-beta-xylanase
MIARFCLIGFTIALAASAETKTLEAMFTPAPIQVDGQAEETWSKATASGITLCMNPRRTAQLSDCKVSGNVKALWNGPTLYLLFTVADPDIAATAPQARSGVQVFVDQFNDKFPKFEEDDGTFTISASGQQNGNRTNAGLPYYPAVWSTHLESYAAAMRNDASGNRIGYTVEAAWSIGDLPLRNGTKIGMEFAINAVASATNMPQYSLYWSSGNNKGTDDNTMWGEVVLGGYDGKPPMPLNRYMLQTNVAKATPATSSATGLVRGIWRDESAVDRALAVGTMALQSATTQKEIDAANTALDTALRGLRRAGKYPDPMDLPALNTLPDPFTFFNGAKVKTAADWEKRRAEIRDLAEYYIARPRDRRSYSSWGMPERTNGS